MKKIIKILLCILLVICIAVVGYIAYILNIILKDDRMSKEKIFEYVTNNQEVLLKSINYIDELNQQNDDEIISITRGKDIEDKKDNKIYLVLYDHKYVELNNNDINAVLSNDGIRHISVSEKYIEFYCGGYGMGSATGYAGFYYSFSGDGADIDLAPGKQKLVKNGNGWSYKEPDGDNTYYEENIIDKFFYYSAEF